MNDHGPSSMKRPASHVRRPEQQRNWHQTGKPEGSKLPHVVGKKRNEIIEERERFEQERDRREFSTMVRQLLKQILFEWTPAERKLLSFGLGRRMNLSTKKRSELWAADKCLADPNISTAPAG